MALGFYLLPPLPNRLFLVNDNQENINVEDSLPLRAEIIPMWLSGVISVAAGILCIGIAQIWLRSVKDFHRGMLGLLTSLGNLYFLFLLSRFYLLFTFIVGTFFSFFFYFILTMCTVGASWFQVICKIMIGGLRPNFLSICQPDLSLAQGQGYGGLYYDKSVCTGDKATILDALEVYFELDCLLCINLCIFSEFPIWTQLLCFCWTVICKLVLKC